MDAREVRLSLGGAADGRRFEILVSRGGSMDNLNDQIAKIDIEERGKLADDFSDLCSSLGVSDDATAIVSAIGLLADQVMRLRHHLENRC
jgi:hypothetical protein